MTKETKKPDLVKKYVEEFKTWKSELKRYWEAIDKNQEMYEFYKREDSETESQISLNTPFSIIESMVAKANEATLNITVNAKGEKGLGELETWISSVLENSLNDPDVAQFKGSFRKIRERFFRELLVKGNAIASIEWFYKTQIVGGKKKIVADNPYIRIRDYKSVIFNPSKTLCDSDVYYIESHVKLSDLKNQEYDPKTKKGLYKNLGEIKDSEGKLIDSEEEFEYSNGSKIAKKKEPIRIIERWEGTKLIVIANDKTVIREEDDPFQIGGHNLVTAMNYVVGNRPYAYGEIDSIYKSVRAQDTIVNQSLDIVNRYLRPAVIVDPASNMDLDQLIVLIESGGVMSGNPQMIGNVPTNTPPSQAFQSIDILQQAIERAARYSPYSAGVPSQQTDKTNGTATGISKLQAAAEPNFQVKLDTLEESFMQPVARKCLQMIASKMGKDDLRYGLIQGKSGEWVMATKNVLMGQATMEDMIKIGYVTPEEAQKYVMTLDPETQMPVEIPGVMEALVFDIDWIVSVKLDNQSAADKEQQVSKKMSWVDWSRQLGVQFSPEKTSKEIGKEMGVEDPDELFLSEEEQAQVQQQQMMQQQQQMQSQQQQARAEQEKEMMMTQAKQQHDMQKEQVRAQANMAREQLRGQNAATRIQP